MRPLKGRLVVPRLLAWVRVAVRMYRVQRDVRRGVWPVATQRPLLRVPMLRRSNVRVTVARAERVYVIVVPSGVCRCLAWGAASAKVAGVTDRFVIFSAVGLPPAGGLRAW